MGYSYSFGVERDPAHPDDYDAFFWAISDPVVSHTLVMPNGQATMEFEAMVSSGTHTLGGRIAGKNIWRGLVVTFKPLEPQRAAP